MAANLYTQTPGALHMGGGYANPFAAQDMFLGNIYGPTSRGDAFARFGTSLPGHALTLGGVASMASGLGIGGRLTAGIGNTLGLGTMSLGPQMIATAALQYAASQFSRGQEQNQIAQNLSQRVFGERNIGGRMGMGASRDAIAGFSSAFRELANSSEMLTNDQELKNVLNKFTDMKLLDTSKNLAEMGARVKKMSTTLRDISMDLGTTLEGALPAFQRHAQMGFMDPEQMKQSIRTNRALRGVGISMGDATITSFEMAQAATNFAMGGDRRIGALGAQRTLGNMSVATSMGLLTDEDLMAATGKRGEDAVADLSQQSMQASSAIMQSAHGRLLAAALGDVGEDGRYTGGIDQSVKRRLKTMSMDEISQIANKKLGTKGGAASFERRMKSGMGANMGASLDMSEFSSVLNKVFDNEDTMAIVLEQLTGMRGQTLDVLLKVQKDGDRIVKETERRTKELSQRNRLNAIVQQEFTLSGRLDRAYRDYIAEPIAQPLQTMGSEFGTALGKYVDNFGTQILENGVGSGIGRALFGLGINDDGAEQSYDDRLRNRRSAVADMFGAGTNKVRGPEVSLGEVGRNVAISLGGFATGNIYALGAGLVGSVDSVRKDRASQRSKDLFSSGQARDAELLAASSALQEREFESGRNSTSFGETDEGFLAAYKGTRQDIELNKQQKRSLLRGLVAASAQGGDIENMTEEFAKTAFGRGDGFTKSQRDQMEKRGGQYGLMKQLANDKTLTEGERAMAKRFVDQFETQLRSKATLGTAEDVEANLKSANSTLADLFDTGTDGFEENWLDSDINHIENDYFASLREGGQLSTLESYMKGLSDETTVRKLSRHKRFSDAMSAEDAIAVAKDVFGVEITKGEGETAKDMFKMLFKRITSEGVETFTRQMKPMAQNALKAIAKKKTAEGQNRKLALLKSFDQSTGLDSKKRKDLREAYTEALSGGDGSKLFDMVSGLSKEELGQLDGQTGRIFTELKGLEGKTSDDLASMLQEQFQSAEVDGQKLSDMTLEELKTLAVQSNLVGQAPAATGNTAAGRAAKNLSPDTAAKLTQELSDNVASNIEIITSAAMRYQAASTQKIKELEKKTGG